ncbi:MAG TPA: acyltransferase [Flavisolibacter sp.]
MNQPIIQRNYYPALDGLRGLACLLVVVYHNFGFINYFFFGWLGLDIFFVLSGFLITDILLNSLGTTNYLGNFYIRRVLRIFPLYYLTLIIFLVIIPLFPTFPLALDYFTENQVWLWTYLQNWLFVFYPNTEQDALVHLWSLAVEEQFYLFWPLVVMALRKPKYLLVFISLVLLLTIGLRLGLWLNRIENLSYYNLYTFTRIDGICIGCMVALLQRINVQFLGKNTALIVFGFAGLNFLFYFINKNSGGSFPYLAIIGYTTFAMIFGLLVYDIVNKRTGIITSIFSIGILKFFGRVSYGCYIIHWPLYLIIGPWLRSWSQSNFDFMPHQFFASFVATALAFFLGYLSFRYFESRFLQLRKHFL